MGNDPRFVPFESELQLSSYKLSISIDLWIMMKMQKGGKSKLHQTYLKDTCPRPKLNLWNFKRWGGVMQSAIICDPSFRSNDRLFDLKVSALMTRYITWAKEKWLHHIFTNNHSLRVEHSTQPEVTTRSYQSQFLTRCWKKSRIH